MPNAYFQIPQPYNEKMLEYAPGSPERDALKNKLAEMKSRQIEIPLIIGGKEVKTGKTADIRAPHNHDLKLGVYHKAERKEVEMAIEASLEGRQNWANMPWPTATPISPSSASS